MPNEVHCSRDVQRCGARSYLEMLIQKEIEQVDVKLEAAEAANALVLKALETALQLQAKEYERRLENLNNEHGRVAAAQAMFATKETIEVARREEAAWRLSIQDRIEKTAAALPQYVTREAYDAERKADSAWKNSIAGNLAESRGASARTVYIVGVVMALLALGLRFIPGL